MARRDNVEEAEIIESGNARNLKTFVMEGDPFSEINGDADIDEAFISMRNAFEKAQVPGTLRVYKVPIDENGNPVPKAAAHIVLASYAIDQYNYDDLVNVLKSRFMKPGETMTVRICATRPGRSGFVINKMMTLQREADSGPDADSAFGQIQGMARIMMEGQERTTQMMERILTPKENAPVQVLQPRDTLETIAKLSAALTPLLAPVLAAFFTRPKPQSDLGQLISAVVQLKGLASGDNPNASESDSDSVASILKAIGPSAMQAIAAIASRQPAPVHFNPQPQRAIAPPARTPATPETPVSVTPETTSTTPPPQTQEQAAVMKVIREQLSELIALAEAKQDPVAAAEMAAQLLPAEYDAILLPLIESPESFAKIFPLDARAKDHAVWLEAWRAAMLAQYEESPMPGTLTPAKTP